MILTPIPCAELAGTLDRFMGGLSDKLSWEAFARIRATSPDRAAGAEAEQHRPSFDNTDHALEQSYDSGYFGAVGLLVLPKLLLVSHSENWLSEDGSNRISLIDRNTGARRGQIEMALGHPPHACPDFPVPFVSPTPPPVVPFLSPDPGLAAGLTRNSSLSAREVTARPISFRGMRARMTSR